MAKECRQIEFTTQRLVNLDYEVVMEKISFDLFIYFLFYNFCSFILLSFKWQTWGCKPVEGGSKVLRIAPIVSFFMLFPRKNHIKLLRHLTMIKFNELSVLVHG